MLLHFFLIVAIVFAFLFYPSIFNIENFEQKQQRIIKEKKKMLRKKISVIINHIQLKRAFSVFDDVEDNISFPFLLPEYVLEHSNKNEVEGKTIYLCFWNKISNKIEDDNSLIHDVLCGISHLLCQNNVEEYSKVEKKLLSVATILNYYDPQNTI